MAGFAFAFSGFCMTHAYAGQASMVWAAAWYPWVLYFLHAGLEENRLRPVLAAAACLALAFFEGYPQMTLYGLLLAGLFLLDALLRGRPLLRVGTAGGVLAAGFLLLAACQAWPSYEFVSRSNRWEWGWGDVMTDYLSPRNLLHFLWPDFSGNPVDGDWVGRWGYHELVNYVGWVPLLFFLSGLLAPRRIPRYGFFLAAALLFTALALGESTTPTKALFRFFYDWVPGFDRNRSIGRLMAVATFAVACGSGMALHHWLSGFRERRREVSRGTPAWVLAALALTMLDLWNFGSRFVRLAASDYYLDPRGLFPEPFLTRVLTDPTRPRIMPDNRVCTNLLAGVGQVGSPDGTFLAHDHFLMSAVQNDPDSHLADLVRLRYLYHKPGPGFPGERWREIQPHHYENPRALPRVWMAGGYEVGSRDPFGAVQWIRRNGEVLSDVVYLDGPPDRLGESRPGPAGTVHITAYGNNRVVLEGEAHRPGLVVLTDTHEAGWRATLGGESVPIRRAYGAFRAVEVPESGPFRLEMCYRPLSVVGGMVLSLLSWTVLAGWRLFGKDRPLPSSGTGRWGAAFRAALGLRRRTPLRHGNPQKTDFPI